MARSLSSGKILFILLKKIIKFYIGLTFIDIKLPRLKKSFFRLIEVF